jgi:hypothetical protein
MYKHSPIKISMLVPARPESKFLNHLVMAFLNKTKNFEDTELLVMPARRNDWNRDMMDYISRKEPSIKFIEEPEELGQRGHHVYMNELVKHAGGDWIVNFCDDMDILMRDWDEAVRDFIRHRQFDPDKCWMLIPRFLISGAVEHILSRGWIDITGHDFMYPNGDSWLNGVMDSTPEEFRKERRIEMINVMFEDYSHDPIYEPLFGHGPKGLTKAGEDWHSDEVQNAIKEDAAKLWEAYRNGR